MAHQAHNIPWSTVAANFEYVYAHAAFDSVTNLFPRFKPTQGQELNYFVRSFARTVEEHSMCERRKFPDKIEPVDADDIVISDVITRKLTPTVHRWRVLADTDADWLPNSTDVGNRKLCHHMDGAKCSCPIPYQERKMSAFLRQYTPNTCYSFFDVNEAAFFNLELVKTLLLYGEMDIILKVCSHPEIGLLEWYAKRPCPCGDSDIGWDYICGHALRAYMCLNVLYCMPELWDENSTKKAEQDYRHTKCYQQMLHHCTRSGGTSSVARFPHNQFFGIADDQFCNYLELREANKNGWRYPSGSGDLGSKYPYGLMPIDDFLTLDSLPPYQPSAWDVAHICWILREKGLPVELALGITEFADYKPKRRLKVPNDPLNAANREELLQYLAYCWQLLIRCDMLAKALGDQIPWDRLVANCIMDLWGIWKHKGHRMSSHNKRAMYEVKDDEYDGDGNQLDRMAREEGYFRYLFL